MNLKICSKCGKSKDLSEFYIRKKGSRKGKYYERCKQCMKERGRKYYRINHEKQLKLALVRRAKHRNEVKKLLIKLKNKPCSDCSKIYPYFVMDWDHRSSENKEKEVARMVAGGWSKNKILDEIKKCDLVCTNCHRIRTFSRLKDNKYKNILKN